ncbi:MAG: acetate uptake transporter [Thermoplasmata archaeon]|nr:acetate uptake transporter [Thermoplasmata archaeon]
MTQSNTSRDIFIKELPGLSAEPAALGLFGLAIAALVLATTDLGFTDASAKSLMIPWVIFFGATAQFIAGIMDFKRNNIFGATVFTTYSMLWYAVGLTLYITIFTDAAFDLANYGFGLVGILAFSFLVTIASLMTNKALLSILIFIDLAVAALVFHVFYGTSAALVGIFLAVVALLSFYAAGAVLINAMAGKTVMPLGKAIWKP